MRLFTILFLLSAFAASAQKSLLIERANRAKTTKLYIGDQLHFQLKGEGGYWYTRTISDLMPESKSLLLNEYLVHVDSIAAIKVQKGKAARIIGGAFLSLGISLPIAMGGALLYGDKNVKYGRLLAITGASLGGSYFLLKPRKLKMGQKHRLRIIEIKFPDPLIPPPTFKN